MNIAFLITMLIVSSRSTVILTKRNKALPPCEGRECRVSYRIHDFWLRLTGNPGDSPPILTRGILIWQPADASARNLVHLKPLLPDPHEGRTVRDALRTVKYKTREKTGNDAPTGTRTRV